MSDGYAQDPESADPDSFSPADPAPPGSGRERLPGREEILQQIVRATTDHAEPAPVDLQLRQQFRDVAQQHRDHVFGLDPVVLALVSCVTGQFRLLTSSQRDQITAAVAQTLFDDTGSRMVLERLWQSLVEGRRR